MAISEESTLQMLHPYKLKLPEQSLFSLDILLRRGSDNKARKAQRIMRQYFQPLSQFICYLHYNLLLNKRKALASPQNCPADNTVFFGVIWQTGETIDFFFFGFKSPVQNHLYTVY